ncbi:putative reverse transcriptase domain-containing protein [Tanacetum coccineum]
MHTTRGCTYKKFLNCQPLNFKGTEGAVGLARWFEKIECVFNIRNCAVECQVKYDACTLLNGALTWWNSYARTVRLDEANEMSWKEMMKLVTEGLLCLRMVHEEEDKAERYIWGLPDSIQGNVTSARPVRLQDDVKLANSLMDQKQPPFKRHNVARAYTAGPCTMKCTSCKKVGHMARDCRSPTITADQRAPVMNQRTTVTCFECGKQGHYKSDCPKLKNQNHDNTTGNVTGSSEARGRVYALGGGNAAKTRMLLRFDVIIGMDWLSKNHAVIVYDEKIVRIPYGNEILIVRGCHVFLANITEKKLKDKLEEKRLKDVPVVRDFLEVFPKDLLGRITLYRFSLRKMKELSWLPVKE